MSWKGSGSMMFLLACTATLLMASWEVLADGDKSIAGVLDGLYDEFEFLGSEGQVLFAELKAENYQNRGRNGGSGGGGCSEGGSGGCSCDGGSGGGCSDGGTGGCSDGGSSGCTCDSESTTSCSDDGSSGCSCDDTTGDDCSGGGSGGSSDLCLQVVDIYGDKVCWAGRPARPGWQRDPRLGCPLPAGGTYFLRVFVGQCGSTDTSTYQDADSFDSPRFYRLYLTLMDVEDEGLILEPKEPKEQ